MCIYPVWWMHTHKQSRLTHAHFDAHMFVDRHALPAPWFPSKWFVSRDPSYSAGLNKSHQVGSDSSYVDGMPNVIWRLGEHGLGLAAPRFMMSFWVLMKACCRSLSFSLSHTRTHTHAHKTQNSQKHTLAHSSSWRIIPSLQSQGHQFNAPASPPHTHTGAHTHTHTHPPVCFVLHVSFPLRTPMIPLVTEVIVMHPCLKSCQHFLTVTHTFIHTWTITLK